MSQNLSVPAVDVQSVMRQIRVKLRGGGSERDRLRLARRIVPGHVSASVGRLRASVESLRGVIGRIGEAPPQPATLRGRVGGFVVGFLQRALFWYTPSVRNADLQIVDALESHLRVTTELIAILERTNVELARLAETQRDGGARP